jgi:hypothetical protein
MPISKMDQEVLRMALVGYETECEKIDGKMAAIRALLGGRSTKPSLVEEPVPVRKRRKMSAAARRRIGDATRKRWAALRGAKKKNS